jgi:hypothetical protein
LAAREALTLQDLVQIQAPQSLDGRENPAVGLFPSDTRTNVRGMLPDPRYTEVRFEMQSRARRASQRRFDGLACDPRAEPSHDEKAHRAPEHFHRSFPRTCVLRGPERQKAIPLEGILVPDEPEATALRLRLEVTPVRALRPRGEMARPNPGLDPRPHQRRRNRQPDREPANRVPELCWRVARPCPFPASAFAAPWCGRRMHASNINGTLTLERTRRRNADTTGASPRDVSCARNACRAWPTNSSWPTSRPCASLRSAASTACPTTLSGNGFAGTSTAAGLRR